MIDFKLRIARLFYILSDLKYHTSQQLAESIGVSVRTIKSEINELQVFAKESGCILLSQKGYGYCLSVTDEHLFGYIKEQIEMRIVAGKMDYQQEDIIRTYDIARILLVASGYITIDEIADSLFLSSNAIKSNYQNAKKILQAYNLSMQDSQHQGEMVTGREFDKRVCMLYLFDFHYQRVEITFKSQEYTRYFVYNGEQRKQLRRVFLTAMRHSDCHVRDKHTHTISLYLVLAKNRFEDGFSPCFTDAEASILCQSEQYAVAQKVFWQLDKDGDMVYEENEALALTLLLLLCDDIDISVDMEKRYSPVYATAHELAIKTGERLYTEYHCQLSALADFVPLLTSVFIPMLYREKFGCTNYYTTWIDESCYSPYLIYLTFTMKELLFQEGYQISQYSMQILLNTLETLINRVSYNYTMQNLLVCNINGIEAAKTTIHDLKVKLNGLFFRMEPMELYEADKCNLEEFDLALLQMPVFDYRYTWPFFLCDKKIDSKDIKNIRKFALFHGYNLSNLFQKTIGVLPTVLTNFKVSGWDEFIRLLSCRYAKTTEKMNQLEHKFTEYFHFFPPQEISAFFLDQDTMDYPVFEIYCFSTPLNYKHHEISYVIVLSLLRQETPQEIRFLSDFMNQLLLKEKMETLLKTQDVETVFTYMTE